MELENLVIYKVLGVHGWIKNNNIIWNKERIIYLYREYDIVIEYDDEKLSRENNIYYYSNNLEFFLSVLDSNHILEIIIELR